MLYATASTVKQNSNVFFKSTTNNAIPGIVHDIFAIALPGDDPKQEWIEHIFFVIHPYLPKPASIEDPFEALPDFGAKIYSSQTAGRPTIVPASAIIAHAIMRAWPNSTIVAKALDRVSDLSHFPRENLLMRDL